MGPRLFSRGNYEQLDQCVRIPVGFNGATAFQPWKLANKIASSRPKHASMGPRLFSRGNLLDRHPIHLVLEYASMGPRLFSRGNQDSKKYLSAMLELQWGHGFSAVETARIVTLVIRGKCEPFFET